MPTDEQVSRAVELIRASETNYRYFFDQLDDPRWLSPLAEHGFFRNPPEVVTTDDGKIYFPDWPEGQALLCLAPRAPEMVYKLLETVDARRNDRVRADVVRAAARLPVGMASRLATREAAWLATQPAIDFGLPASFAELITALVRSDAANAAYELTAALFGVLASDQRVGWRGVKVRMDVWEYGETAQAVFARLLDLDAQRTLALTEDLLEEAMAFGAGGAENAPVDHSDIWRPAIENCVENLGQDASETLIVLVRDLARDAVAAQPNHVEEMLARMRQRPWHVFWRIGLYLLMDLSRHDSALARRWLMDRELFFCERVRHEYLGLARALLPILDEGELRVWRAMLDEGPQYEGLATRELRQAAEVDDEAWVRMQERWRRDRLAVVADRLPEELQRDLAALTERQGEPEDSDCPTITSWVGPTSPVSAGELKSMSAQQVISMLAEWKPDGQHFAPSPEGLGRRVTDRVAEDPLGFTQHWRQIIDLEPTYARSILAGLDKAVREGLALDWDAVLALSEEIIRKPDESKAHRTGWHDFDPDWSWSRKTVASLLVLGIERRVVPANLAGRTWGVIEPLTWDADPAQDYETSMDPLTFSINTTRGQAMHAAIALGAWWATEGAELEDTTTLEHIQQNLESHLDPEKETSPAVRAAFGARMAALINIGEEWFERQLPALFPQEVALLPLRLAVWESFLAWTHPHQAFLRTLRPYYAQAVADLSTTTGEGGLGRDPRLGLAEHLATYYMWGYLSLDDQALLAGFFDAAPTATAAHVISFIGRGLDREEDEIPQDAADRLMALWVWLVARLTPDENPNQRPVFEPFGWWFGAGRLDPAWELEQLDSIVSRHVVVDPEFRVLPRLRQLLPDNPVGVLVALKHYLEAGGPGWRVASASREIRAILEAAQTDADPRLANEIQHIANLMITRGMIDFRDLTRPAGAA